MCVKESPQVYFLQMFGSDNVFIGVVKVHNDVW